MFNLLASFFLLTTLTQAKLALSLLFKTQLGFWFRVYVGSGGIKQDLVEVSGALCSELLSNRVYTELGLNGKLNLGLRIKQQALFPHRSTRDTDEKRCSEQP